MGASLIIWFSKKGEIITEILSSKIFVFFGLISYSLYLWHYPIFAFLRYFEIFEKSIIVKLCAILLTILISIFSYYFIERPFRKKKIISLKTLIIYILISVIILLSYSVYILNTEGIKKRFDEILKNLETSNITRNFLRITNNPESNVLLMGDSHAAVLIPELDKVLEKENYNFFSSIYCSIYLPNFQVIDSISKKKVSNTINDEGNEILNNFIKINQFNEKKSYIIWSQYWSTYLLENKLIYREEKNFLKINYNKNNTYVQENGIVDNSISSRHENIIKNINATANNLLNQGFILILIYPVPEAGFDVPKKISKEIIINKLSKSKNTIPIISTSYDFYKKRNLLIIETLNNIRGDNVYRVYPDKFFCNTLIVNRCIVNNKETLFYFDDNHLSAIATKFISQEIRRIIKNNK